MDFAELHRWEVGTEEAIQIQNRLADRIVLSDQFDRIETVAGCDVAYSLSSGEAYAAIVLFSFPGMEEIGRVTVAAEVGYPYLSGLLAFREGPILLKAFEQLNERPGVVIFNGQGIAHPRRFGLASHLGLLLDLPAIGCAQKNLYGKYELPSDEFGSMSVIRNPAEEAIGICLRTRAKLKPLFISQGHKITLETAVDLILRCTGKYKLPLPVRAAHIAAGEFKLRSKCESR